MKRFSILVLSLLLFACGDDAAKKGGLPTNVTPVNNSGGDSGNMNASNSDAGPVDAAPNSCTPETCDDGDACTSNATQFSPVTCDTTCSFTPITTCASGDGCCPDGCTVANDVDCDCEPRTCDGEGVECGSISTGCGSTIDCGTCQTGFTCDAQGICQEEAQTPCSQDANCPSTTPRCVNDVCVECVLSSDCGNNQVCLNNRCGAAPPCSDANPCTGGLTCNNGTCEVTGCNPSDPTSCPSGSFCDQSGECLPAGAGGGCGYCLDDCTCPNGLTCDMGTLLCTGCDPLAMNCPEGQSCLPFGSAICFPLM